MGNFNRNDRSGGGRNFGRRSFGGGSRDPMRSTMHRAVCAECGNDCEVPFQPRGDRPIYCSNCFEKRRNVDSGSRGQDRRNYGSSNYEDRRMHGVPGGDSGKTCTHNHRQIMEQLDILLVKLDKIISAITPLTPTPKESKPKAVKSKAVHVQTPKIDIKEEKSKTEKKVDAEASIEN